MLLDLLIAEPFRGRVIGLPQGVFNFRPEPGVMPCRLMCPPLPLSRVRAVPPCRRRLFGQPFGGIYLNFARANIMQNRNCLASVTKTSRQLSPRGGQGDTLAATRKPGDKKQAARRHNANGP